MLTARLEPNLLEIYKIERNTTNIQETERQFPGHESAWRRYTLAKFTLCPARKKETRYKVVCGMWEAELRMIR